VPIRLTAVFCSLLLVVFVSGCTKQTQSTTSDSASASPQATTEGESPAADTSPLAEATPTPTPTPTPIVMAAPATAVAVATAPASSAPKPLPSGLYAVTYTDIAGTFGETAIRQVAELGVFGNPSGTFRPHDPVTRAQFVEWLVRTNNIYMPNNQAKMIRPAETAVGGAFVDVPPSLPAYRYLQGMADAGYVIGVDKTHFVPNRDLTREELIAILVSRDQNGHAGTVLTKPDGAFVDAAQLSKPYWGAFHDDDWDMSMNSRFNRARIFGSVKTFHPQRPVTREEVAIALQEIDGATAGSTIKNLQQ